MPAEKSGADASAPDLSIRIYAVKEYGEPDPDIGDAVRKELEKSAGDRNEADRLAERIRWEFEEIPPDASDRKPGISGIRFYYRKTNGGFRQDIPLAQAGGTLLTRSCGTPPAGAELSGVRRDERGRAWSTGSAVLTAPEGFQISRTDSRSGWNKAGDALLLGAGGSEQRVSYYLRERRTGRIYEKQTVRFGTDRTAPEITGFRLDTPDGSRKVRPASDHSYTMFFRSPPGASALAHDPGGSGIRKIFLNGREGGRIRIPSGFKGFLCAYCYDSAGNRSGEEMSDGIVVEDESLHRRSSGVSLSLVSDASGETDRGEPLFGREPVRIRAAVRDRFSGIRSAAWQILSEDGEVIRQQKITIPDRMTDAAVRNSGWNPDERDRSLITSMHREISAPEISGRYTAALLMEDNAGHRTRKTMQPFCIDRDSPDISVRFGKDQPASGNYFRSRRTAYITVRDRNITADRIRIRWRVRDGAPPASPGWRRSADGSWHTSLTFFRDGAYRLVVEAEDLAGNRTVFPSPGNPADGAFILDGTVKPPEITGIRENGAYRRSIYPSIRIQDPHLESWDLKLYQTDRAGRTAEISHKVFQASRKSAAEAELTGFIPGIPGNRGRDGRYRLEITVRDKAGNAAKRKIIFSLNCSGSEFVPEGYLNTIRNRLIPKVSRDLVILEKNPAGVSGQERRIEVTRDAERIASPAVEITESGDPYPMIRYRFDADGFSKDGIYQISIATLDRAGNRSDMMRGRSPAIRFTVDHTPPEISAAESTARSLRYEAFDAIGLAEIRIAEDGKKEQVLRSIPDRIHISGTWKPTGDDERRIRIAAVDLAGNVTKKEVIVRSRTKISHPDRGRGDLPGGADSKNPGKTGGKSGLYWLLLMPAGLLPVLLKRRSTC